MEYKKLFGLNQIKIKTICIGHIFLGVTGKTSLSIEMDKLLKDNFLF